MIPRSLSSRGGARRRVFAPVALGAIVLTGCSTADGDAGSVEPADVTDTAATVSAADPRAVTTEATESTATPVSVADTDLGSVGTLSSSEVHDIEIEFDQAEYDAMLTTYLSTEDKEWISATVTIDGTVYENVGLRLKGNSSLRSISADADPATIPWLVKLDEFVDGQHHDGLEEFVIRSSSSTTALNEAVALELLDLAGLAAQDAISVRLSVNGGDQVLRLVIDSPDGEWMAEEFDDTGALYKAESTGDWSYRGDDPESYDEVFDQEAGSDNADLTPLIDFLQFVNESDDTTFDAELGERLDVESFATYLAMQDLLDNFDDIDGPGNNAYLYYDTATEQFTVVPWDYNLAFGSRPGGMGGPGVDGGGFPGGGDMPTPPEGFDPSQMGSMPTPPGGGREGGPGGMNRANALVDRFLANEGWNALYEQAKADLQASLYDSGAAASILEQWSSVVATSGLVDDATIATDASAIESYLS